MLCWCGLLDHSCCGLTLPAFPAGTADADAKLGCQMILADQIMAAKKMLPVLSWLAVTHRPDAPSLWQSDGAAAAPKLLQC